MFPPNLVEACFKQVRKKHKEGWRVEGICFPRRRVERRLKEWVGVLGEGSGTISLFPVAMILMQSVARALDLWRLGS